MTDSRTDEAARKLLISFHPNPRVAPLLDGDSVPRFARGEPIVESKMALGEL